MIACVQVLAALALRMGLMNASAQRKASCFQEKQLLCQLQHALPHGTLLASAETAQDPCSAIGSPCTCQRMAPRCKYEFVVLPNFIMWYCEDCYAPSGLKGVSLID